VGDVLIYRFEIDSRPSFDSPERQVSPDVPEGAGETSWTPPAALGEDTLYFWRASASDGNTSTPSPIASFFVNVTNEPPEAPVPLDPVEGRVVGTATPTLRLRNAVDPENDALSYELEVRDAGGALVAAVAGVPSGDAETTWTVTPPLTEDRSYTWTARASDGELTGPRSAPAAFRVDAVAEPPTAPTPYLPEEGAAVENRRPELVVQNATSPDGRPLTYTFELYARAADGTSSLVEQVTGIPEAPETTAWTPSSELADGTYEWRARASDPLQAGPWSATARFEVRVDVPPAAPTGLNATPGDRHVVLTWNASPETDVTGYRVYRATASGGPYDLVGPAATHAFDDIGLTNGVTYYYVVTALDAHHESPHSAEAAARPEAPMIVVEVRYDPSTIEGECLLTNSAGNWAVDSADRALTLRLLGGRDRDLEALTGPMAAPVSPSCPPPDQGCPKWLYATLEMPPGHDPATIDVASLRLLGSVSADPAYRTFVDVDRDGLPELRVRFRFERVAPLLVIGVNEATIVGRAGSSEVQGSREITVSAIEADMRVTPRTINRRSCGEDIKASLTFAEGVSARDVSISSVRLNEVVAVDRVVRAKGRDLVVKFDRAAVNKILPLGEAVEVRVTGTLRGLAFVAVDHVRVIE
jgi:hypothetical protein